ncbi:FAD-binding oxidoreductase, partial [Paracoccus sp. (in: a-proteobacteria)]|uniref:FAD-binding oxidoreductase n=1 Tax=Paracoccus sp. TaxID=267 RepID=UPI0026E0D413
MLNPADDRLIAALPESVVRPLEPRHLDEPRGYFAGRGGLLAAPRNVEEVAAVVRACAVARVAVLPRGGGTGLVAGSVMPQGPAPLVLSLERMTAIRNVWPDEDALVAEAGVTLQQVQEAAASVDRQFPLSLASQGTAQIGGVLAANAGGTGVLRWGNARALCLGIEAVMPDGSILRDLKRLRKDNTGYSLRDLLIGAEGTLGIITAATLKLAPRPAAVATAMLEVPDPQAALQLLSLAQAMMAGCVTTFELISGQGLAFVAETLPEIRQPLPGAPWSVLLELSLPKGMDPDAAVEDLLGRAMEEGLVLDGAIAQSGQQAAEFWNLREHLPEAN